MTAQIRTQPDAAFLEKLEANAVRFARGAGDIVLGHFRTALDVEYKARGQSSPVTVADRESEEYLRRMITETYPTHSILGEEGKDWAGSGDDFTWVLDPVDGTANFISGLPIFAVSIGVLFDGEPVAAAIFVPTSSFLQTGVYHARRGSPAFLDDTPIMVAAQPAPESSKLAALPGFFWRRIRFGGTLRQSHGEPRTLGSIAVELALTASGTLQYAFFNRPKIWDVAAGVLLVRQAGGLALAQPRRSAPWLPLSRFESPPSRRRGHPGAFSPARNERSDQPARENPAQALERLRNWGAAVVVGNPEMAWAVAGSIQRRPDLFRPIGAIVKKAVQLPLFTNGTRRPRVTPSGKGPRSAESRKEGNEGPPRAS